MLSPDLASSFAPSLRNYLHIRISQSGLTPAEIARRARIAPALLYRFLNNQRDLSLETIDKILPVIDGEIWLHLRKLVGYYEELVSQQRTLFDSIATLQAQEGEIESAILGLKEAIQLLAKLRDALGSDFREAIGYDLPEPLESSD